MSILLVDFFNINYILNKYVSVHVNDRSIYDFTFSKHACEFIFNAYVMNDRDDRDYRDDCELLLRSNEMNLMLFYFLN